MPLSAEELVGRVIGGYHLICIIGKGGASAVFLGETPISSEQFAIKVLLPPPYFSQKEIAELRRRFTREAQMMTQRLRHPRILPVLYSGEDQETGYAYMVMPYIQGGTLTKHLAGRLLPLHDVARYLLQIADALDYAHQNQVIHRDIKPGNILIDKQNNIYLVDFGIVKLFDIPHTTLTEIGRVIGTPEYMSPEQALGEQVTKATDIYSLGVIAYLLVTGEMPFPAAPVGRQLVQVITATPTPPSRYRADLNTITENIILRALHKKPEKRFASAGDFAQAFVNSLYGKYPPDMQPGVSSSQPTISKEASLKVSQRIDPETSLSLRGRASMADHLIIGLVIMLLVVMSMQSSSLFPKSPEIVTTSNTINQGQSSTPTPPVQTSTPILPKNTAGSIHITTPSAGQIVQGAQSVKITDITPQVDQPAGGSTITLNGSGFAPGDTLLIGGVPAKNVQVQNSNQLTALIPAHTAGLVDLVLKTKDGQSIVLSNSFVYNEPAEFTRPYGNIVIDGFTDVSWYPSPSYVIPHTIFGSIPSGQTLYCIFRGMWDDNNLYLIVHIITGTKVGNMNTPNLGDGVEIDVSGDNSRSAQLGPHDEQYFFSYASQAPIWSKTGKVDGVMAAHDDSGDGYLMEVKIPWSTLQVKPGVSIGIDVMVNGLTGYNGSPTRMVKTAWWGVSDNASRGANSFGIAILKNNGEVSTWQWVASASSASDNNPVSNILDNRPFNKWTAGHKQQVGDWIEVDMARLTTFHQIVLNNPEDLESQNYPRAYQVFVSVDGNVWNGPVATGRGNPCYTTISFPPQSVRYFKIVLTEASDWEWIIDDLYANP